MGEERLTESTVQISLPGFVIEAAEAERMARESGYSTVEELLPSLVPPAMRRARIPISRFPVGAVGLGSSGRIYVGVNLEFPGLPLHHSVHAEQFLLSNAASCGESQIPFMAVSHMPCGHCRQFLQEVRAASDIQILVTADGASAAFRPLSVLLPRPFGPPDLLDKDVPLLLDPHSNDLGQIFQKEKDPELGTTCNGDRDGGGLDMRLREAAEKAAMEAHAPYSGCPAGFAVADEQGRVFAGAYAESAAYNPSLGPVQAAMIAMVAADGGGRVAAAVLLEKENAEVSHEGTARVFLAAVAPRVSLRVYHYRPSDQA